MIWNGHHYWPYQTFIPHLCLFLVNNIAVPYIKMFFSWWNHWKISVHFPNDVYISDWSHYYTSQAGSVCYGMWYTAIAYTDHCVLAITVYFVVAQATKQWWPLWESYSTVGGTEEPFNTLHCTKLLLPSFFFFFFRNEDMWAERSEVS